MLQSKFYKKIILINICRYLSFFFDVTLHSDNFNFLSQMLDGIKYTKDNQDTNSTVK